MSSPPSTPTGDTSPTSTPYTTASIRRPETHAVHSLSSIAEDDTPSVSLTGNRQEKEGEVESENSNDIGNNGDVGICCDKTKSSPDAGEVKVLQQRSGLSKDTSTLSSSSVTALRQPDIDSSPPMSSAPSITAGSNCVPSAPTSGSPGHSASDISVQSRHCSPSSIAADSSKTQFCNVVTPAPPQLRRRDHTSMSFDSATLQPPPSSPFGGMQRRGSLVSGSATAAFGDAVQGTTDDASTSKLSAVKAGYYEDPYLEHIVRRPARRAPLINRGYYARVATLRKIYATFLNSIPPGDNEAADPAAVQIVNLGAGLDTTYFWVQDFWASPKAIFYEVDFLEVVARKVALFTKKEALWSRLRATKGCRSINEIENDLKDEIGISLSDTLKLLPVDLRRIDSLTQRLELLGFNKDLPTLFVSECALVYLQAQNSDAIVRWAAEVTTAPSAFVMYEQVYPHDAFGRTMVKNLELRGCPLLSIHEYPTLESQADRFCSRGWDSVSVADMNRVYDHFIDKYEIVRVQGLELFDEIEEWRLIQAHYFIAVAVKGRVKNKSAKESISTEGSPVKPIPTSAQPSDESCSSPLLLREIADQGNAGFQSISLGADSTSALHPPYRQASSRASTPRSPVASPNFVVVDSKPSDDVTSAVEGKEIYVAGDDSVDLEFLNELSKIWDLKHEVHEEMPRHTTAELQRILRGGPLPSRASPALSPGLLSPLMRPSAMGFVMPQRNLSGGESQGLPNAGRKWSLGPAQLTDC